MPLSPLFDGFDWRVFLVAMAVIELTPGPNMGWLAARAAQAGRCAGFKAVAGVTAGLLLQLLAAMSGLAAIIAASPVLYEAVRWAGIGFMLFLAWDAWRSEGGGLYQSEAGASGFGRGLAANLLNPKTFLFYLSVVGQFADPARGPVWQQSLILGLVHLTVSIAVHSSIVFLGARLGRTLRAYGSGWPVRLSFALALVGLAVWMMVTTARS